MIIVTFIAFKEVEIKFLFFGQVFVLIPSPTIKNFLPFLSITSCKIPQTFFFLLVNHLAIL